MARNLYGTVIIVYRCNTRCNMCNCLKYPTKSEEEITLDVVEKLPEMAFTNVTGGGPFMRGDIPGIIRELYKKSDRIVISTNGYFTDRIIGLCREFPKVGVHIGIEGLQRANDQIRGISDRFNRGYRTPTALVGVEHPDVGFRITAQGMNCEDLVPLYRLSGQMGMEFATVTLHSSFYFRKNDNHIEDKKKMVGHFEQLICELLKSSSPKKQFRAYFNHELINYIYGNPRLFTCDMSRNAFFISPLCDVVPCDGMCQKAVMGNLGEQEWEELWSSEQARQVRRLTRECQRNCWMIGSASPAMHRYIWVPAWWIMKHKFLKGGRYFLNENSFIL